MPEMINEQEIKTLLKIYPVLSGVDQEPLAQALSNASLVTFKEGTQIFDELQTCNAFPFILSGKIRVYKQSVNGRELSLYTVFPGDACVITAGCLLADEPYNASGLAKADSNLVMMRSSDFENLLGSRLFREYIFSLFSRRIVELMQLVEEVAFHKVDRRLAALLLQRGRTIHVSHQELANELGTVREMITRVLKSFSDTGLIALRRGQIDVLDESALKHILDT
jgi:CRP/FNR family transcriptional regulator